MRGLTAAVAQYALSLDWEEVPASVKTAMRILVCDAVACGLVGATTEPVAATAAGLSSMGAMRNGRSRTLWVTSAECGPDAAGLLNSVAVRSCDWNDVYVSTGVVHPSDNVAGLLAVAERTGASFVEFLAACLVSYELHCRFADAGMQKSGFDNLHFGAVAASAAACRLLGCSHEQTLHALDAAAVSSVALGQTRRGALSMWKEVGSGYACRSGVTCAYLAASGVTAPVGGFDGEMGLLTALGSPLERRAFDKFEEWRVLRVQMKRYPAQFGLQPVIAGCLALRASRAPLDGDRLVLGTFARAAQATASDAKKWWPRTRETADHSLPYCAYVSWRYGRSSEDMYHDELLLKGIAKDELSTRVRVGVDAEVEAAYPDALMASVSCVDASGLTVQREVVDYDCSAGRISQSEGVEFAIAKVRACGCVSNESALRRLAEIAAGERPVSAKTFARTLARTLALREQSLESTIGQ